MSAGICMWFVRCLCVCVCQLYLIVTFVGRCYCKISVCYVSDLGIMVILGMYCML